MPCPLRSHKVITPNKYQLFFPNQLIAINNTVSAWLLLSVDFKSASDKTITQSTFL